MAENKDNLVTEGLSGKIGNLVFRRRKKDGKIFVSKHPVASENEPTTVQKATQERFQQATLYGRMVTADPQLKAEYQAAAKAGQSPYNVAIADYFHAPQIVEIDMNNYDGRPGSTIRIEATDDFAVQQVSVKIENGDGSLVEEGQAVQEPNKLNWIYTATVQNESLNGDKITVTATDRPQNVTEEEKVME